MSSTGVGQRCQWLNAVPVLKQAVIKSSALSIFALTTAPTQTARNGYLKLRLAKTLPAAAVRDIRCHTGTSTEPSYLRRTTYPQAHDVRHIEATDSGEEARFRPLATSRAVGVECCNSGHDHSMGLR